MGNRGALHVVLLLLPLLLLLRLLLLRLLLRLRLLLLLRGLLLMYRTVTATDATSAMLPC